MINILILYKNIKARRNELKMSQQELAEKAGYTDRSSIAKIESGKVDLTQSKIKAIADALQTTSAALMGENTNLSSNTPSFYLPSPNITEDYVTFPVIGEVAAGYDIPAMEDWSGDVIDIPTHYLKGRKPSEFFVLQVKGDSMFPAYHDGDKVLVLKQTTLNYSGQVGVVIYDGDIGTLKKVEYVMGEDWMRLVPINPNYKTIKITDSALEQCRVLGIPKLLIREVED